MTDIEFVVSTKDGSDTPFGKSPTTITIHETELDVTALNGMVLKILLRHHQWLTPYQIRQEIEEFMGRYVADSTITSRIRDLRLSRYGSHQIDIQRMPHSHTCIYRLVGK